MPKTRTGKKAFLSFLTKMLTKMLTAKKKMLYLKALTVQMNPTKNTATLNRPTKKPT